MRLVCSLSTSRFQTLFGLHIKKEVNPRPLFTFLCCDETSRLRQERLYFGTYVYDTGMTEQYYLLACSHGWLSLIIFLLLLLFKVILFLKYFNVYGYVCVQCIFNAHGNQKRASDPP